MTQDELAEIDGIKPNVVLVDGEEKEVGSQSRYRCSNINKKSMLLTKK
jgi:hypothetical protein